MCIRDSGKTIRIGTTLFTIVGITKTSGMSDNIIYIPLSTCLLYTSDAADERSSVDLGGRRIIKKKNTIDTRHDSIT